MAASRRIALVTGGAQGLGRAIAERLAGDGMTLVIADVRDHHAHKTAQTIFEAVGVECLPMHVDVSNEQSVKELYEQVLKRLGRLDILINNAGIAGTRVPLESMDLADWEAVLRINLTGAFLMSRGAVPIMRRQKWGRIVNIASQAARSRTGVGKSQYAAAKAGMIGFARVLADEVGRDGITVNCVAPSRTLTPLTSATAAGRRDYFETAIAQTAVGRLAEPMDTASLVAFLCSDEASFLTGTIIDITGGSFMP